MSTKSRVDADHYRVTSDDGKTSTLYERSDSVFFPDRPVEVADNNSNGTTTAYEYDGGLFGLFRGGRGGRK